MSEPTILKIERHDGVAGEFALTATVQFWDEPAEAVTFKSSVYGGPIVMVTDSQPAGVFIDRVVLDRVGSTLDAGWVERFLS